MKRISSWVSENPLSVFTGLTIVYLIFSFIARDGIVNWPSWIAFTISLLCLAVYAFFLAPKQFFEIFRPKDWLSGLRLIILGILLISIISSIPSLVYQYYRMIGQEYQVMRSIATISGQISKLGTTVLLVLVFTYRRKS